MKRFKLVLTLIIFLIGVKSYGTHISGYDMSLVHLTGDTYRLKVRLYRDANSSSPSLPTSISFSTYSQLNDSNIGLNITVQRYALYNHKYEAMDCAPATANFSLQVGEYEYIFTALQALSLSNPFGYYFSSTTCCRDMALNIFSSESQGYNFTLDFPALSANSAFRYNSSPSFPKVPLTTFCVGKPATVNWQCTDPDGDSLSYSIVPSWDGVNSNKPFSAVAFAPSFNLYYNIMDGNPDITIHPISGDINFTASKIGKYYIMIKVNEYRKINGLSYLIGTTYREVLLNTIACVENPPVLSALNVINHIIRDTIPLSVYDSAYTYSRFFTGQDYISDSIIMKIIPDQGAGDNVFSKYAGFGEVGQIAYGSAGEQNEIISAGGFVQGKFRWVVDSTMTRNTPYHFKVFLRDQTCPVNLTDVIDVYIYAPKKNCTTIFRDEYVSGCDSAQDLTGKWYYVSGFYWDVYTNSNGCEVITKYDVNLSETNINQSLTGCDSVLGPNNIYYYATGIYTDTVKTSICDTIIHSNVKIIKSPPTQKIIGNNIVSPSSIQQYFITPLPATDVYWYVKNGNLISGNRFSASVQWGNFPDGSITAIELSSNGCYATNYLAVDIFSLGINTQKSDFKLFPNPTSGMINIESKLHLNGLVAEIYDTKGVLLKNIVLENNSEISISEFENGIYFVKIQGNTYKLIKL